MAERDSDEIVIVKIKRDDPEEEGAHAGTWKIAYADFVTAMMAFFLLMWLVNATTEEQRDGLSAYFNPVALSTETSGADGLNAGRAADTEGALTSPNGNGEKSHPVASPPTVSTIGTEHAAPQGQAGAAGIQSAAGQFRSLIDQPQAGTADNGDRRFSGVADRPGSTAFQDPFEKQKAKLTAESPPGNIAGDTARQQDRQQQGTPLAAATVEQLNRLQGLQRMEALKQALAQQLQEFLKQKNLQNNIQMDVDAEGLRIQITDDSQFAMFPVGQYQLTGDAQKLLDALGSVLAKIPNGLIITGHTDGRPYAGQGGYGNWELAADRSNAARRALVRNGLAPDRIIRVEGYGDRQLLTPEDPANPRNRRISILVYATGEVKPKP